MKIEVEHRGLLAKKKFDDLKNLFAEKGEFLGLKKRFSLILNTSEKSVREVKDDPIDLKLRITNKKPELVVKHGQWGAKDSRAEFSFHLEKDKFDDMLSLLQILGYKKFVLMANTKLDYLYNGVEYSLVEVPDWGYYFEAEILTDEDKKDAADKLVENEIAKLDLKILDEENYFRLLDDLNNRDGCRIDFEKDSFANLKAKYAEYF